MGILGDLKRSGLSGDELAVALRRAARPVTGYGDVGVTDADEGLNVGRVPVAEPTVSLGLARITDKGPAGEADHADARYWVEWVFVKPGGRQAIASLTPGTTYDDKIATVTNVQELDPAPAGDAAQKGTHLLAKDRPVWVYAVEDLSADTRLVVDVPVGPLLVRVTAAAAGGGKYTGVVLRGPAADVAESGNLAAADFGTDGPACLILNAPETGKDTHWLTAAENELSGPHVGRLLRVNADGKPVVQVAALPAATVTVKVEDRVNEDDDTFEAKTREVLVVTAADESDWTPWHAGEECPAEGGG